MDLLSKYAISHNAMLSLNMANFVFRNQLPPKLQSGIDPDAKCACRNQTKFSAQKYRNISRALRRTPNPPPRPHHKPHHHPNPPRPAEPHRIPRLLLPNLVRRPHPPPQTNDQRLLQRRPQRRPHAPPRRALRLADFQLRSIRIVALLHR